VACQEERERERQRERDRQTGRQTDRQAGRQTDRQADGQREMYTFFLGNPQGMNLLANLRRRLEDIIKVYVK